jgi:opacity protein-like surface antigen
MKKIVSLSALLVLLFFAHAAAQPGPYLGVGVVFNDHRGSAIKYLDPGFGLNLRFGYNFGLIALEGNLMGSNHEDTDPGFSDADFEAFTVDLKVFLSREYSPNQFYLLVGAGSYWIEEFDPFEGADTELSGGGWNLGAGLERFVNSNLALNLGVTYRFIEYDEFDIGGFDFSLRPREDGDVVTIEAGIIYHF